MSIAFDNSDLEQNLCNSCNCKGFIPKIKYEVDLKTETVKCTEASLFDTGDKLEKVVLHLYDNDGKQVNTTIAVAASTATLSLKGLNYVKLNITATVISANGCRANLGQYNIGQYALSGYLQHSDNNS